MRLSRSNQKTSQVKKGTELGSTEDESLALYNMVHYKKAFENLQEQRQEIVKYLISGA
ncbi:hypothetical protein [Methanomethylovorans sp.]|uniref:hypothetical protein n=1 Tax=Methanomethylovorans sp. TaxID=2758717 RepID=UPI00351BFD6A